MKTFDSIEGLSDLEPDLLKFILGSCPWIAEEWNAEEIGFVFVLEDSDKVTSVCTVPHIDENDYRDLMTIDLDSYDLLESPAFYDEDAG